MRFGYGLAMIAAAFALTACGGTELQRTRGLSPTGAYNSALYNGYIQQSASEFGGGHYASSDVYARKARLAANNQAVPVFIPNDPKSYPPGRVPDNEVNDLVQARASLVNAMERNAGTVAPAQAAQAQVMFDCWVEQQSYLGYFSESNQPDDAALCRNGFRTAMASIEQSLQPAQTQAPRAEAAPAPTAAIPNNYMVFFDFDRSELTPPALDVLTLAQQNAAKAGANRVRVVGHTDTAGSSDYNMELSERRAQTVREALGRLGLSQEMISTDAAGERQPLVATGEGVREPQNRRAEITFVR
jgi:OOP family OmpA-OmpF porin